ncbi:MAG: trigger factor [Spirochaetales bacterium]|uniref:Trigger factor n=1 Tax=Candidatus Thalassospirochaeta sargassi TaxID=3119039 RepID=A0AAJ1MJS5_9SPIO|nr:trigger factor [Spirochaetales bacterium]
MIVSKNLENLEKSSVKLTVTVGKDAVNKEYNELLNKYAKDAHIKGFRKGKAPAKVLEQKFGESIRGEATMNLMENSLKEAYEDIDKKPLPYATPVLQESEDEEVLIELDNDFTFAVTYDTMPDVKIGDYKGLEIEAPVCKIGKKEVDRELETIREQNSTVVEKAEGKAEKDDIVNIDYCELDADGNEIEDGKREDFVFTIGSGYNVYKLDDDITGMAAGEEKTIEKEYTEDDTDSNLAGRKVTLKVKLNSVKVKELPELDDDLAQDVSDEFETLKDLKASIKKRLTENAKNIINEKNKQAVMDLIIEGSEIEVPESMIKAEMDQSWNQFISQSRMPEDQVLQIIEAQGKTKDEMMEEWRPAAEKNVKTYLITEKLIEEEKIEVSDEEVDEEIKKQAESAGMSYEDTKNYFEQNGMSFYLKNDISNRKLFDLLIKSAEIKEGAKKDYLDLIQNKE